VFGIGSTEFILMALVLLIFVGPKHLPDMLRKFGRIVSELRSASRELRTQIEVEMEDIESPSKIAKDMTRDMARELTSEIKDPYDELRRAANEEKKEIQELVDEEMKTGPSKESTEESGQA
jgi:sec-independent protein translocase protein TatB